jgi:serine/threonine-protein kinase
MLRRPLSAALLLTLCAVSPAARAGDAVTAEALFREGRSLMDAGNFSAACPKLAESYTQDAATGTLLALAMCQEQAGQTASAWATYAEVVARAKQDGRADREQAARDHLAALDPKLSRLTITVEASTAAVAGLLVKRDGKPVGQGTWGTGVPMDPGEHLVEAMAPGKRAWRVTVKIGTQAEAQTVKVPVLDDGPAAAPMAAPPAAAAPPASAPSEATTGATEPSAADAGVSSTGAPLRAVGLVVGGAGIVGLGLGTFFGLHAKSLNDQSKQDGHCTPSNECDATGGANRDDAKSAANVATVALIAGGLLTATGVTLFLVGGPKKKEAGAARVEATAAVSWNEAAVVVRGQF